MVDRSKCTLIFQLDVPPIPGGARCISYTRWVLSEFQVAEEMTQNRDQELPLDCLCANMTEQEVKNNLVNVYGGLTSETVAKNGYYSPWLYLTEKEKECAGDFDLEIYEKWLSAKNAKHK